MLPPAARKEIRNLLHGIKLSAQAGGQDETPPAKLLVVPWGLTQTAEGPLLCDDQTATILPERQRLARADRVPIDFDHAAAFGAGQGGPRNFAGYGTPKVVPGEGIWLMDIRWTPEGRKFWANYEDISPAIKQQKATGRVTFLDSVALTPRGMVEGLSLFSAEGGDGDAAVSNTQAQPSQDKQQQSMDLTKLKNILRKLGITFSEEATAEELMSLLEKAGGEAEADSTLSAERERRLKDLETKLTSLESAAAAGQKASDDARKQEIIRTASAEGKILPPDDVIANLSAEDLKKCADAAKPGVVPGNPGNAAAKGAGTEKPLTLSAEDKEAERIFGISDEQSKLFHSYGKAPLRSD